MLPVVGHVLGLRETLRVRAATANAEKINMSYFCLNLGQTAEDSDMFTIIWLRSRGLRLVICKKIVGQ